MNQVEVKRIAKQIWSVTFNASINGLRSIYKPKKRVVPSTSIKQYFGAVGLHIPISILDSQYTLTDWATSSDALDVITELAKNFKWTKEVQDCDNRTHFVITMYNLMTGCNNCGTLYLDVFRNSDNKKYGRHYCNFIIDNNGAVYLYDVDFKEKFKMEKGEYIVGKKYKYKIYSGKAF
ncbi:MAG: hypothetical protein GY861_18130 [bacterium]|nr:hypothetical protein [bacterium]